MKANLTVMIKGAGEMASGVAWRLHRSHLRIVMTEVAAPLAVRRAVSFCEAVYDGRKAVEGVEAVCIDHPGQVDEAWSTGCIPLLVDPQMTALDRIRPDVLVEATLSKRNTGIAIGDAPLVIALGPGFEAGRDAHFVVETARGHHLGRLYTSGQARKNTGVPGTIGGFTTERVLRAPAAGTFESGLDLGERVGPGQVVATVDGHVVKAEIGGIVRGLLRTGTGVPKGMKLGDIDPRGDRDYLHTISEKARAVGGAVLEGICRQYNNPE